MLSIQSVYSLPPKQLQWAFVQLSITRPSTVHLKLSYAGPEAAPFLPVRLQSRWKGRSKSCLGNATRTSECKMVEKTSIPFLTTKQKKVFPLGRLALLHSCIIQCLQKSILKSPFFTANFIMMRWQILGLQIHPINMRICGFVFETFSDY